jgi:hypothetical protein
VTERKHLHGSSQRLLRAFRHAAKAGATITFRQNMKQPRGELVKQFIKKDGLQRRTCLLRPE